jgi:hypothetical protein
MRQPGAFRSCSLQVASSRQQQVPRPTTGFHGVSATGKHGVYASGKRWQARIGYGGKKHTLGNFGTKEEAALAYDRAAREHGAGAG